MNFASVGLQKKMQFGWYGGKFVRGWLFALTGNVICGFYGCFARCCLSPNCCIGIRLDVCGIRMGILYAVEQM